jgi:hypothetical protein
MTHESKLWSAAPSLTTDITRPCVERGAKGGDKLKLGSQLRWEVERFCWNWEGWGVADMGG